MNRVPVCIITGGNTGIGFQVAKKLLESGYRVILACRSAERGEAAAENLAEFAKEPGSVEFMQLDLNDRDSIKSFVDAFLSKDVPLNLLINNAAVYNSSLKPLTEDKIDQT